MTEPPTEPTEPTEAGPLFVVLSGPSGAGKDTLLRAALARDPQLATIATAKTRPPRSGEEHGIHHLFLSEEEFGALLAAGAFLEHAVVYGHRSGVPRDPVRQRLAEGKTVVARTDVQGARTLRDKVPGALLIFLTVPDRATLERRLHARNADSPAERERRLTAALGEMAESSWFDYVIVNRDGGEEAACDELLAILRRERARTDRPLPAV